MRPTYGYRPFVNQNRKCTFQDAFAVSIDFFADLLALSVKDEGLCAHAFMT